jgi:hypothetical protein
LKKEEAELGDKKPKSVKSYQASGIDGALELLSVAAQDSPKTAGIDRHPERRQKAAYKSWSERRILQLRVF